MTKHEELYKFMKEHYVESERVACIPGPFIRNDELQNGSDEIGISFSDKGNISQYSYYDEKNDTLCVWGRNLGLVYKQGVWATKKDGTIPMMSQEIY